MTDPTPKYEITFLRHGESVGNAEGYHQGQADFPLTDHGRFQAQALAEYWASNQITFDQIFASPLARARQTAEIINKTLKLPLSYNPMWMERDNGLLAGLPHAVAAERYPMPDSITLYQPTAQTGESLWELYLRAARAIETIMQQPPGRYLIVSHGALLNMAFHTLLGLTPCPNYQGIVLPLNNTGLTRMEYRLNEHRWRIHSHNEQPHLQPNTTHKAASHNLEDIYQFTLLRHGESEGNVKGILQGQLDYPLTEHGQKQVEILAKHWSADGTRFDKIITSSLQRAYQTAQIISEKLQVPVESNPAWIEFDWGQLNGLTGDEINQRQDIPWDNLYAKIGGDGESRWEVFLRASRNVQDLMNLPPGRFLVVAHGAILSRFIFAILGIAPQNQMHIAFKNTATANLRFLPKKHLWVLDDLNNYTHLPSENF